MNDVDSVDASGLNGAKRKRGRPKKAVSVIPPAVLANKKVVRVIAYVDMGNGTWLVIFINEKGELDFLLDPHGVLATPAAVGMEGGDPSKMLFGHIAARYEALHPEFVCTMAKRARGTDFVAIVDKDGREWMASELEAKFLKWRLSPIEERHGLSVAGVVVTVPANFADHQRRGTGDIVQAAGYQLVRILNEPSAGIIAAAYGKDGLYLIFDLGHGTLDVSVVRVSKGRIFDLLATAGRDDLGGAEFTSTIVEHCLEVLSKRGVVLDPVKDAQSLVLLRQDCEAAKCDLSSMERVTVVVRAGSEIMDIEITRDLAESLWQGILDQCTQVLHESLASAGLSPADIHGAIPGGGASRALCVQNLLVDMFTAEKVIQVPDPQKLIVQGAAMLGESIVEERISAGDTSLEGVVTAQMLEGKPQLRDITPLCMGVEVRDSAGNVVLGEVVAPGSNVPGVYSKIFGLTGGDHGADTTIRVLEGKANMPAGEAMVLAEFSMSGLPAGPTKERIQITFTFSSDGVVDVKALDLYSGIEIVGQVDVKDKLARPA